MPYVVTSECILCGACEVGCESDAITEGETQSIIHVDICVECGTCFRNCPTSAIIFVEDSEYEAMLASTDSGRAQSP